MQISRAPASNRGRPGGPPNTASQVNLWPPARDKRGKRPLGGPEMRLAGAVDVRPEAYYRVCRGCRRPCGGRCSPEPCVARRRLPNAACGQGRPPRHPSANLGLSAGQLALWLRMAGTGHEPLAPPDRPASRAQLARRGAGEHLEAAIGHAEQARVLGVRYASRVMAPVSVWQFRGDRCLLEANCAVAEREPRPCVAVASWGRISRDLRA